MRIIGGKDYYDGAMAFGTDTTVVLKRTRLSETDMVPADDTLLEDFAERQVRLRSAGTKHDVSWGVDSWGLDRFRLNGLEYSIRPTCVWFAGVRHPGFRIATWTTRPWKAVGVRYVWSHDELLSILANHGIEPIPRRTKTGDRSPLDEVGLLDHFADTGTPERRDWLVENRVSVAIWSEVHSEKGWRFDTDGLQDIDFARHLDPWTAFQELSMYVGGVLPRQAAPIVQIQDEATMVKKHGFDRWTFRRQPESTRK